MILPPADPEVASKTFFRHLGEYWGARDLDKRGWSRVDLDDLHTVIGIVAIRPHETKDLYYFRLGAEYYDLYPPTTLIVTPADGWPRARAGSTWWPRLSSRPDWFGLHDSYQYQGTDGTRHEGQLLCFSMTAEYYMSSHSPTDAQRWRQGRHRVAATLSRLAEVLRPPYYEGPDAARPA